MGLFDLELTPPTPTDQQKVMFRRAVMAGIGRTSLDPQLSVFMDRDGYGAITKKVVEDQTCEPVLRTTEVYLGTDGIVRVDNHSDSSQGSLARRIHADRALREREEAIRAFCTETGRSRQDAEFVIIDHLLSRPGGEKAAELLLAQAEGLSQQERLTDEIDGFTFGDLTNRIIRNFVAY